MKPRIFSTLNNTENEARSSFSDTTSWFWGGLRWELGQTGRFVPATEAARWVGHTLLFSRRPSGLHSDAFLRQWNYLLLKVVEKPIHPPAVQQWASQRYLWAEVDERRISRVLSIPRCCSSASFSAQVPRSPAHAPNRTKQETQQGRSS